MKRVNRSLTCAALFAAALPFGPARAQGKQQIGANVVLNQDPTPTVLADLENYGKVLNVIPEIRGVVMRTSALATIQTLSYVEAADPDSQASFGFEPMVQGTWLPPVPDLSDGSNRWNLDAIGVTDAGVGGRTVAYDGEGVYVAIIDTGLMFNWRDYFPEERISVEHSTGFSGGGGGGVVVAQPGTWEHATFNHGTAMTGVILGFRYQGPLGLPQTFNGVAPKATVIHIWAGNQNFFPWNSTIAQAIVHVTNLKLGELGNAPLVLNFSGGTSQDGLLTAALDYAIANGVVCVSIAGNEGANGMTFPGRYPPVISAAAAGWASQFPPTDPTQIEWILDDVPENDPGHFYIAPYSSRALPGQDLDVAAPAPMVPSPSRRNPDPS